MRAVLWLVLLLGSSLGLNAETDVLATLRAGHPRLLITPESMREILAAESNDELRAQLHQQLTRAAEAHLSEAPIEYVLVGPRLLAQSRKAMAHVTTGAMAFRLTGDRRYAQHAIDVMLTASSFPDWNPSHFLDVAEMATALALGYDWLFDELSSAERATIKKALLEKALAFVRPAYGREDPKRESFPFVGNNLHNNWNQVCNGGFLLAALALADEEPAVAREVIAGVRWTLPHAMRAYEPDGAYPEGPVYWGYGTRYNVLIFAALESALGQDFDLTQHPSLDRTALYRLHVESPTGLSFNYADGRPGLGADSGYTWLAQRYGIPAAIAHSRRLLQSSLQQPPAPHDRFLATHVTWFPAPLTSTQPPSLDIHFRGPSEIAILRGAWDDPRALWVGLKAGSNRVNHGHLDLGSFVLDADGQRWAYDLGPDDYDLPGYWDSATIESQRWKLYRLNNLSHNTVTPDADVQDPDAVATITAFLSTPSRAFAIADVTAAYPKRADRFRRGVQMIDRSRVLVQDELEGVADGTRLTWQMLTPAQVALEGRSAVLTQGGRTMRVDLLSPESARFRSQPATPPTAAEEQNKGITRLYTDIVADTSAGERDVRIAVLLTPVGERWPERAVPALVNLKEWK
jgi:hypothetical protein